MRQLPPATSQLDALTAAASKLAIGSAPAERDPLSGGGSSAAAAAAAAPAAAAVLEAATSSKLQLIAEQYAAADALQDDADSVSHAPARIPATDAARHLTRRHAPPPASAVTAAKAVARQMSGSHSRNWWPPWDATGPARPTADAADAASGRTRCGSRALLQEPKLDMPAAGEANSSVYDSADSLHSIKRQVWMDFLSGLAITAATSTMPCTSAG